MKQMWNKLADKQKPLLLFGLAVVVALVVTVLIHGQLKQMTTTQAQARETQTVVVAAVDLPWGTSITGPMVKTMTYLKESVPAGHFTDPAALVGRTNIYPLKAGEPLFESQLAPTTVSQGGVAALVTPKKRAMGVKVDKVVGVSGFIHPGNRVDVLVTLSRNDRQNEPTTKIVLENILVLATGTELEKSGKQEKPAQVDVITLEVTPEEGEKLALAATGRQAAACPAQLCRLPPPATHGARRSPAFSPSTEAPKASVKKAAAPRPAPAPGYTVETIRGSKVTETNFKKGE